MPLVVARGVAFHTQELGAAHVEPITPSRSEALPLGDVTPPFGTRVGLIAAPAPNEGIWAGRTRAASIPPPAPIATSAEAAWLDRGRTTPTPAGGVPAIPPPRPIRADASLFSAALDAGASRAPSPAPAIPPSSRRRARTGPTSVVMLHGLLIGSLASWYFTAAPALAKRRRVMLYDLRGHGRSERTATGYDLATMTGDLQELADRFDDRPIDLVGHSYGGLIALRFALDHPGRVRRLVLVEAPLPPSRFSELEEFAARSPGEMVAALPVGLRDLLGHGGRRAARMIDSLDFLANKSSLFKDLRAEPDIPDAELARLACPLLAAYGDRSSCLVVGERLGRVVPDAKLTILPGGHYLHLDAAAALTTAMVEFLDG